ncbi:Ras family protein [Cooperia oncophora]
MGFILMYDITNEESFNSVQDWCTQIKTYSWENAQVVLVGNKCDMDAERVVSLERGRQLADQLCTVHFKHLEVMLGELAPVSHPSRLESCVAPPIECAKIRHGRVPFLSNRKFDRNQGVVA